MLNMLPRKPADDGRAGSSGNAKIPADSGNAPSRSLGVGFSDFKNVIFRKVGARVGATAHPFVGEDHFRSALISRVLHVVGLRSGKQMRGIATDRVVARVTGHERAKGAIGDFVSDTRRSFEAVIVEVAVPRRYLGGSPRPTLINSALIHARPQRAIKAAILGSGVFALYEFLRAMTTLEKGPASVSDAFHPSMLSCLTRGRQVGGIL